MSFMRSHERNIFLTKDPLLHVNFVRVLLTRIFLDGLPTYLTLPSMVSLYYALLLVRLSWSFPVQTNHHEY